TVSQQPELPAAETTNTPASDAALTASATAWLNELPPRLMLITSIPYRVAQTIPLATDDQEPAPFASSTFTAYRVASGATPMTPNPLSRAAMMPATCVPCPWSSNASLLPFAVRLGPYTQLGVRSG